MSPCYKFIIETALFVHVWYRQGARYGHDFTMR